MQCHEFTTSFLLRLAPLLPVLHTEIHTHRSLSGYIGTMTSENLCIWSFAFFLMTSECASFFAYFSCVWPHIRWFVCLLFACFSHAVVITAGERTRRNSRQSNNMCTSRTFLGLRIVFTTLILYHYGDILSSIMNTRTQLLTHIMRIIMKEIGYNKFAVQKTYNIFILCK